MSSSNISSVTKTADAAAISGRTRVVGIYYTCTEYGVLVFLKKRLNKRWNCTCKHNNPWCCRRL
jgi:hypothetical protein